MNKSRPHNITIRMSDSEVKKMKELIELSGMNQQEFLLASIFNTEIKNMEPIRELIPQLIRVGNNLNQLVKAINSGEYPPIEYAEANQKEVKILWQSLKLLTQKPASE